MRIPMRPVLFSLLLCAKLVTLGGCAWGNHATDEGPSAGDAMEEEMEDQSIEDAER